MKNLLVLTLVLLASCDSTDFAGISREKSKHDSDSSSGSSSTDGNNEDAASGKNSSSCDMNNDAGSPDVLSSEFRTQLEAGVDSESATYKVITKNGKWLLTNGKEAANSCYPIGYEQTTPEPVTAFFRANSSKIIEPNGKLFFWSGLLLDVVSGKNIKTDCGKAYVICKLNKPRPKPASPLDPYIQ